MHNKAFIVDNAVAVVGGRNIGAAYFGVDTEEAVGRGTTFGVPREADLGLGKGLVR